MYSERNVSMSWKAGMTIDNYFGTTTDILTLRKKLEQKIDMAKLPKVCLVWETREGIIEKIYDLEES